jgi:hypothetical protein
MFISANINVIIIDDCESLATNINLSISWEFIINDFKSLNIYRVLF